jgi:ADP-ribosyl-[dinitrogen reductase] hydrolase
MLHEALQGGSREAMLTLGTRWPAAPLKHELTSLAAAWQGEATAVPAPAAGSILAILDLVVRAVADAADFRSGMVAVVRQGVEPDVAAAAYGQLAGALFSLEGIPPEWRAALPGADSLATLADRLLICRNDSLQ